MEEVGGGWGGVFNCRGKIGMLVMEEQYLSDKNRKCNSAVLIGGYT
jgi:hypothetical protein